MADSKTEDEDDDFFKDFTFSSSPNHTQNPINTQNSATNNDDEWGDFIEYPLGSTPQLSSKPQENSKSLHPFGSSPDHSKKPSFQHVESGKNNWVKPKGALPLSLFGDLEKEEEEEESESGLGDHYDAGLKKESNFQVGVGINDIIANLYTQSKQIKPENGLNGINLNKEIQKENGFVSNLNKFDFNSNGLNLKLNEMNLDKEMQKENGFVSNMNKLDSNLTSDANGGNEEFDGDDEDEDGWEYKDAYSETNVGDGNDKGPVMPEFSGLEWQSKSAMGQEMQVDPKVQENSKATAFSSHIGNGSAGPKDLFATSNGTSAKSHEMDFGFDFKSSAAAENNFFADSYFQSVQNGSENGLNPHPHLGYDDSDDGFGDFKDGFSETVLKQKEEPKFSNISSSKVEALAFDGIKPVDLEVQDNSKATAYSAVGNGSPGPKDLFAISNGTSAKSHETDIGFDFKSSKIAENSFFADTYLQSEQNGTENGLNPYSHVTIDDSDGNFGGFKAGFLETASKQKEPKSSNISSSEVEALAFDGKNQGNETRSESHKGPVPLSIFGDEELETDSSLNIEDGFMFKGTSPLRNVQSRSSNLSISDLLSNLYSQAEPVRSFDSTQKPTENGLDSTGGVFDSNLMGDEEDDFDDGSWEFKDAVSQTGATDHMSLPLQDAHQNVATKTKLNDHVDFYCKLKDQLCLVARHHLDNLKKAQKTAALSGEDAKVATLDDEIQEACKELHEESIISKEAISEDYTTSDISLHEFFEVLHELKFQALESEYHLSTRLSTAEKELRSAIELVKHSTTMLKILTLVSLEEQSSYVSTWSKILSVCAQELKHGAWIWKQSLEKNVQSQILSEPQGRRFILALGEIYRVVAILGASVKVYKPWILSSSVNFTVMDALLEESHTQWSSLGLEKALPSISDLVGSEYKNNVKTLFESIKHIRNLDAFALGNCVFAQQESLCRLSVLTRGVVPDVKIVEWDGEQYFLPLANLWANMISSDPPKLPCLHVS